jgi:hypothetical protein
VILGAGGGIAPGVSPRRKRKSLFSKTTSEAAQRLRKKKGRECKGKGRLGSTPGSPNHTKGQKGEKKEKGKKDYLNKRE